MALESKGFPHGVTLSKHLKLSQPGFSYYTHTDINMRAPIVLTRKSYMDTGLFCVKVKGIQGRIDFKRTGTFTAVGGAVLHLLIPLMASTTTESKTHSRWKELLHAHGLSTVSPSEILNKIEQLDDAQLDGFYEFFSSIDLNDLSTQPITIW